MTKDLPDSTTAFAVFVGVMFGAGITAYAMTDAPASIVAVSTLFGAVFGLLAGVGTYPTHSLLHIDPPQ